MSLVQISLSMVTITWILLISAFAISLRHAYTHCKELALIKSNLPKILTVRALTDEPPSKDVRIIDGVLLKDGDKILVWPKDVVKYHSSIWKLENVGWTYTDELRNLVPGSVVQVREGLRYAHTSFSIRTCDSTVPLWQHWLLTSNDISKFFHENDDHTFVLVTDKGGNTLHPATLDDVLTPTEINNNLSPKNES